MLTVLSSAKNTAVSPTFLTKTSVLWWLWCQSPFLYGNLTDTALIQELKEIKVWAVQWLKTVPTFQESVLFS